MWWIHLIGHEFFFLKAMKLSVDHRDRIVSRHRSGEGTDKYLQHWRSQWVVASICKWKMFGTTRILPRVGRQDKLSDRGRRFLVRVVTRNPIVTERAPSTMRNSILLMKQKGTTEFPWLAQQEQTWNWSENVCAPTLPRQLDGGPAKNRRNCPNLVATNSRLEAVIAAKVASKYWEKAVNTYVHVIFIKSCKNVNLSFWGIVWV